MQAVLAGEGRAGHPRSEAVHRPPGGASRHRPGSSQAGRRCKFRSVEQIFFEPAAWQPRLITIGAGSQGSDRENKPDPALRSSLHVLGVRIAEFESVVNGLTLEKLFS